jgi:DNA (cytosine-5)-methyltransferase 1
MRAISLFSGVGGLEPDDEAEVLCEIDEDCGRILRRRFPGSRIHDDVMTLEPPSGADIVFGGWPCQDISVAGLKRGLAGDRSGLFFRMVDIAVDSRADTIVAENVPNLLRLENGENFGLVLESLRKAGFRYTAWRLLNARHFGLPHQRRRVFIVASSSPGGPMSLLRELPPEVSGHVEEPIASGFYWTAGLQGINFSNGYSPTLKVGSSLSIPSPPAVFYGDTVRTISPTEAVALQGFDWADFDGEAPKVIYRAMGNAVARPVGSFVAKVAQNDSEAEPRGLAGIASQGSMFDGFGFPRKWPSAGIDLDGDLYQYDDPISARQLANNLEAFIDLESPERLSTRAASGLVSRLNRSGKSCPPELRRALELLQAA